LEKGDIASWATTRYVVVLEGVLAQPKYLGRLRKKLAPVDSWGWQINSLKHLVDRVTRHNVAIEVATFISEEVAEQAADWFMRYDIPVASVEYVDYDWFCKSLVWRSEVLYVIDSDPRRYQHYGQKGFSTELGGAF
jgi:hypothetical protein